MTGRKGILTTLHPIVEVCLEDLLIGLLIRGSGERVSSRNEVQK